MRLYFTYRNIMGRCDMNAHYYNCDQKISLEANFSGREELYRHEQAEVK